MWAIIQDGYLLFGDDGAILNIATDDSLSDISKETANYFPATDDRQSLLISALAVRDYKEVGNQPFANIKELTQIFNCGCYVKTAIDILNAIIATSLAFTADGVPLFTSQIADNIKNTEFLKYPDDMEKISLAAMRENLPGFILHNLDCGKLCNVCRTWELEAIAEDAYKREVGRCS
jgi:hypothetical protein